MNTLLQKGFKGIDQRGGFGTDLGVASEMLNFRVCEGGSLTKRQGVNRLFLMNGDIDGIWAGGIGGEELVVFACGGILYRLAPGNSCAQPVMIGEIGTGECMMFEFNDRLYVKCDDYYGKYDGTLLEAVEGYIPLVAMSCTPQGEGEIFEQINLICNKRRQKFSSNGSSLIYYLAEKEVDEVVSIKVDGVDYGGKWSLDRANGTISIETAFPTGLNNVEIVYSKGNGQDRARILGCKKMMMFGGNSDGRIFLWGNELLPNYRFNSELADGVPSVEYFPVNGFTVIGNSRINCIVQQYDKQLIFTDDKAYYSYCELRTDSLGNVYSSFPVFSLNNGKGCIFETNGCVIDNRPVTLCRDGLNMWESTSVQNEKNAVCFSAPICNYMRNIICGNKQLMYMFDMQAYRELYFIYGDDAYVYNYGLGAWYTYNDFLGKHYCVYNGMLYFAKGEAMCLFGNEINCKLEETCVWKSSFLSNGSRKDCNLLEFSADLHISGNCNLRFEFEKSGGLIKTVQELVFPADTNKFIRVSTRPRLRRAMPFRIWFTDMGEGSATLYGIILKTKDTERRTRIGIL